MPFSWLTVLAATVTCVSSAAGATAAAMASTTHCGGLTVTSGRCRAMAAARRCDMPITQEEISSIMDHFAESQRGGRCQAGACGDLAEAVRQAESALDGEGVALPALHLRHELAAPFGGDLVELRAAIVLGDAPFGGDPPAVLEAVQRRVERALVHLEHVAGDLLDALRDAPAMHRLE